MRSLTTSEAAGERAFQEIKRLCYQGLDSVTLRREAAERLGSVVPFVAYIAFTMDPISGLATGFVEEGTPPFSEEEAHLCFEHIYFEDHLELFTRMAQNRVPVALLSEITGGKLERAEIHREVLIPKGFGYEVRSVLTVGRELWGAMCFSREKGQPDFDEREAELVGRIVPHVGAGLRAAVLREQTLREPDDAAGVLVLDRRGRVVRRTAAAERWLRELDHLRLDPAGGGVDELPLAVLTVVGALKRTLRPETERDLHRAPQLCVRGRSGRWLTLQASLTEPYPDHPAETVVVIAPAGPREVLKLQTAAYGLSAREKEVCKLVVRGYSTKQISAALYISENTVQVHLSHVFEKAGVKSRRELLKRLFFDNLLPEPQDRAPRQNS